MERKWWVEITQIRYNKLSRNDMADEFRQKYNCYWDINLQVSCQKSNKRYKLR